MNRLLAVWIAGPWLAACAAWAAADSPTFDLRPALQSGETAMVEIDLQVGGHMLVQDDSAADPDAIADLPPEPATESRDPLSVVASLRYEQVLLDWSPDASQLARELRYYDEADATIKVDQGSLSLSLPEDRRLMLAELRDARSAVNGWNSPLSREQLDLVEVVGNPLAVDRLLPGRALAEGQSWEHDAEVIGPLLGMQHVAVCDVSSVVTGEENGQVKIRMAGTVHGTVDGTTTEIELRGAYLYHLRHRRITRLNLALKEQCRLGPVSPGLDIVTKLKLHIKPTRAPEHFDESLVAEAAALADPVNRDLLYESPEQGFRFLFDADWYVTAEKRELVALRRMQEGTLAAHCTMKTLPARSSGRETTLEEFERDIRRSLGDHLKKVTAATQWTNNAGHTCLGIIADGTIKEVPIEWRFYLIASPDLPRVSIEVTVEQGQAEAFADADRPIVDSMELAAPASPATASKPTPNAAK